MARYPTFEEYQASGKLKDGLKKCNDILKKTRPDVRLLTTKLEFLYALHHNEDAALILKQLSEFQPPIQDPEELATIEEAIDSLCLQDVYPLSVTAGKDVDNLWDRAVKAAKPIHKATLLHTRFENAVYAKRWADVQKALIALKSTEPTNRVFFLAHVVVTQLLSESTTDEMQKQTQGRLASAFAQKASQFKDVVPTAAGQVLLRQGQYEDFINGMVNASSRDLIRCYRETKQWQKLFDFCEMNIKSGNPTEIDWITWTGLIDSCAELGECESDSEKGQTISKLLKDTQSREARLAEVHYALRADPTTLVDKCIEYFTIYGQEKHCFGDLRQYFKAIPDSDLNTTLCASLDERVEQEKTAQTSANRLPAEITALKIRYFLQALRERSDQEQRITELGCRAIRLLIRARAEASKRTVWARDDACFLAVSCIIQECNKHSDPWSISRRLLQAVLLLEDLLKQDTEVHQAKLALVHIYMKLNLGSLAMKHFETLKVREIQHDTISHSIVTRLSLLHPQPTKGFKGTGLDPHTMISAMLNVYFPSDQKLANCQASVSRNGQTDMLFDLNDLRDALHGSVTRRVMFLEERRMARLMGHKVSPNSNAIRPRSVEHWTTFKDNRDFNATFDFGESLENYIVTRAPMESWILSSLAADVAWCLLHNHEPSCPATELIKKLDSVEDPVHDVTVTESATRHVMREILVMFTSQEPGKWDPEPLSSALPGLQIKTFTDSTMPGNRNSPGPYNIREHYVALDCLKIVLGFCAMAKKQKKFAVEKIQKTAEEGFKRIQKHALEQEELAKSHMPVSGILDGSGDELSNAVVEVVGEDRVEKFIGSILETTRAAWRGVAEIRIS